MVMKRLFCILLLFVVLCGCTKSEDVDVALGLRQKLLSGKGCTFRAKITADYGAKLYKFQMDCTGDSAGNIKFTVIEPEAISGITGTVSDKGGYLTFDGTALSFETIADGQITPVTSPWLFLKALRSGYIGSVGVQDTRTYVQIDDSYREDALHLDIWLDKESNPMRAEILWRGRRILTLEIEDFVIL